MENSISIEQKIADFVEKKLNESLEKKVFFKKLKSLSYKEIGVSDKEFHFYWPKVKIILNDRNIISRMGYNGGIMYNIDLNQTKSNINFDEISKFIELQIVQSPEQRVSRADLILKSQNNCNTKIDKYLFVNKKFISFLNEKNIFLKKGRKGGVVFGNSTMMLNKISSEKELQKKHTINKLIKNEWIPGTPLPGTNNFQDKLRALVQSEVQRILPFLVEEVRNSLL